MRVVPFAFWPAVVAGFLGGGAMTLLLVVARSARKTTIDIAVFQGALLTDDEGMARALGLAMHLVVVSALVFGSLYALLLAALQASRSTAWAYGAALGLTHGLLAGLTLPLLARVHPRVRPGSASSALHLPAPGLFGRRCSSATPALLVGAHVVYGVVVGASYGWL
jgi:hypothetical protein